MHKLFYDHLVIIEEAVAVLDEHKVKPKDKEAILKLMDTTLQYEILDVIFTYLPKEKHAEFLNMFHATPHDMKLLEYLQKNTNINMELAILDRANKTKRKLFSEVTKQIKK